MTQQGHNSTSCFPNNFLNFKELKKGGEGTYRLRETYKAYQPNECADLARSWFEQNNYTICYKTIREVWIFLIILGRGYEDICIHIADSLCYTAETNTTLQSNYTPIKTLNWKRSY